MVCDVPLYYSLIDFILVASSYYEMATTTRMMMRYQRRGISVYGLWFVWCFVLVFFLLFTQV